MLAALLIFAVPALPQGYPPAGSDWQLPLGTTNLTSDLGPYRVHSMTVPLGSTLRVLGKEPFVVIAEDFIHVEGTIDARGGLAPSGSGPSATEAAEEAAASCSSSPSASR